MTRLPCRCRQARACKASRRRWSRATSRSTAARWRGRCRRYRRSRPGRAARQRRPRRQSGQGFQQDPLGAIVRESGVEIQIVIERIRAMLRSGAIRRVRQTLLATNLAKGALVAWKVPIEKMDSAFNYLYEEDPFSGHVVTRTTDTVSKGSNYKLWTTLKVPQGYSIEKHGQWLLKKIGGDHFRLMPAKRLFALGVGHVVDWACFLVWVWCMLSTPTLYLCRIRNLSPRLNAHVC